jgi:hypothetical protein
VISLEYVEWMEQDSPIKDTDLVAFVSLYTWNYLCQPPLTVNFVDSMRDIGQQIKDEDTWLRVPSTTLDHAKGQVEQAATNSTLNLQAAQILKLKTAMYSRLANGYSLVRHRTASGEETVAYNRGPLIPTAPPALPGDWPYNSSFGQDYEIFDRDLGIMDISYSSAWELGKLLAASDSGFVAALMRVRMVAHQSGVRAQAMFTANTTMGARSRLAVFNNLPNSFSSLSSIASSTSTGNGFIPDHLQRRTNAEPMPVHLTNLSANDAGIASHAFVAGVQDKMAATASSTGDTNNPYNEINLAASSDWAYVHSWILDHMWLSQIPTHYYLGDPSFLPPESIRFFEVSHSFSLMEQLS